MAPPPAIKVDDPTLLESDPEDSDFQGEDSAEDSSSDSDDDDDEQRPKKRVKVQEVQEPSLTKAAVDDLWASFNAAGEDDDPYAATGAPTSASTSTSKPKTIKISVSYDFVGEKITQEKEVLEDSKEAKDWLARQKALGLPTELGASSAPAPSAAAATKKETSAIDSLFGSVDDSAATPIASTSAEPTPPPPTSALPSPPPALNSKSGAGSGPPKKKKGGGLGALVAGLGKPAKLNTLEKSKLDWNKFVEKSDLGETLTHARKDGYLDKQDFLGRTEQAREDAWEKNKAGRRGK